MRITRKSIYKEKYDELIDYRRTNPLPPNQYGEKHHIIPRSICPELRKENSNIIRLSAREHFLAHYWLFRHYQEIGDITSMRKMAYALFRMKAQIYANCTEEQIEEMATEYEYAVQHKPPMSEYTKRKIGAANRGKSRPGHKPSQRSLDILRHKTEEHRKKISDARKAAGKWCGEDNPKYGRGAELIGEKNPMWGRHRTEDEKQNLSRRNSRPVAVYREGVLIMTFHSVREAVQTLHINGIGSMITGRRRNTTPYTFSHISMEEYENAQ